MAGEKIQARWVRWQEFNGWKPWQRCEAVEFRGPWVLIWDTGGLSVAIPDHIIRGRVEWAQVPHDKPPRT